LSLVERGVRHFEREEADAAFACLSRAAEQQSNDPRVYAYLAFLCARQGLAREAEDFIARALELDPARQAYRAALGESFLKAGDAAAAAHHLQLAVAAQPGLYAAYPALAESYRQRHDYDRAIAALEQADAPDKLFHVQLNEIRAEAQMRARTLDKFAQRAAVLPYCSPPGLDKPFPPRQGDPAACPIWQYWGQGEAAAPAIVRAALASVKRHAGARQVIVLDDATVENYVQIPACIRKIQLTHRAHFSDWLRVALLARHGGAWVDASVFLSGPLDDEISRADFFVFSQHDFSLISNWLIHAAPGHPLIEGLQFSLENYWEKNGTLLDHFLFHLCFEALVTLHPELRRQWDASPRINSRIAHQLWELLLQPFDPAQFAAITTQSHIHKLTYKFDGAARPYRTLRDVLETMTET
jgi:hypothetical protein